MRTREKKIDILLNVILIFLIFFATVSVLQGVRNAIGTVHGSFDFQYDSALLFRLKINPYDESLNPTGISEKIGVFNYYDKVETNQFPSLLTILVPLTYLRPYTANIAWVIINLISTVIIIVLSRQLFFKKINKKAFAVLVCCMLAGTGWRNNIGNGQHTIFSFAFFLIALWLSGISGTINRKAAISGIALALSYFKYTLTVPLALYFIYKKRYKEFVISVLIHLIATPVCAWWLNDSVVNMIRKPLEVAGSLSSEGYIDFGSILHLGETTGIILAVVVCILLFILSALGSRFSEKNEMSGEVEKNGDLLYSILSYVSLIIIYHRNYDFFITIIPTGIFAYQWMQCQGRKFQTSFLNMVMSTVIFVFANFVQKVIDMLRGSMEVIKVLSPYLTAVYALTVYIFVGYLVIQYCGIYKELKALKNLRGDKK